MTLKEGGLRGSLRNIAVGAAPTASVSMFQSPIYQFWAGDYSGTDGDSPVPYPEILAGLSDATAVGGPTFNADYSSTGTATIDYDGTDDGHDWSADSQLPTSSTAQVSVFCIYYTTVSSTDIQKLSGYGTTATGPSLFDGMYRFQTSSGSDVSGGSHPTNQLDSMGVTFDNDTGAVEVFGGGSSTPVATGTSDWPLSDNNHSHGYEVSGTQYWLSGGLAEIVYCDTVESGSDYASYHTNRLG